MIDLTPKQIDAIHIRMAATCTMIQIQRASPTATVVELTEQQQDSITYAIDPAVEVSFFARGRLIETVRIQPGGAVKVLP